MRLIQPHTALGQRASQALSATRDTCLLLPEPSPEAMTVHEATLQPKICLSVTPQTEMCTSLVHYPQISASEKDFQFLTSG